MKINFLNISCEAYTCPSYNERYDHMLCTLYIRMAASVEKMAERIRASRDGFIYSSRDVHTYHGVSRVYRYICT